MSTQPTNIDFTPHHRPPVESGEYDIAVKQTLSGGGIDTAYGSEGTTPLAATYRFFVAGERFSIAPKEIHSVFPPDQNVGQHTNVLPHILINRTTLPWEREGVPGDAKDIFHEALLVTYQKVSQPGFCLSCQLSTYIFAVARRLWLKKLRGERPLALQTVGMVDDIEEEGIEELVRRMKRFKLYEDKFAQLSEGCRKLLQLFLQGTPAEVIRQQFGYSSISYTRKRKCQCKAKLIKLVMEAPEYKDLTQHDGS